MREQKKNRGMKSFISFILATAMVMTSIPGTLWASAEELSDEYSAAAVGGEEFLSDGSEEIANGTAVIADPAAGSSAAVASEEAGESDGIENLLSDGSGSAAVYAPIEFEKVLESGLSVKVKVPEDVFPEGTTMQATDVAEDEMESLTAKIKEDLDGQLDGEIVKVLAADISFLSKDEISLLPGSDVDVTFIPSDEVRAELKEKEEKGLALTLVHIPAEGKAVVFAEEKIVEKSVDGIAFKTIQFPRYAIVATAEPAEETPAEPVEELKEEAEEESAASQEEEAEEKPDSVQEELVSGESAEETGEGAVEEAEQAVSAKVEGVRKSYYTSFTAELSGATVTASVPYYYVSTGTTMEASFAETEAYESIISGANYGKDITDLKAIEIRFADRRGREISLYSVNLSIELKDTGAEKYVLYQPYKGWFGTELYQLRTSRSPKFNMYSYMDTYVIAGLKADGIDRVAGVIKRGTTTFNLTTEDGTAITVSGSKRAFSEKTYLEVQDADSTETKALAEAAVAEKGDTFKGVIKAFDISFHTSNGTEIEPAEEVTVTIETPLVADKSYDVIHISDEGYTEVLDEENVSFDENGATFTSDEFSTYVLAWKEDGEDKSARIHWGYYAEDIFTEFTDTASLDSNAGSMSLDVIFDGYLYSGAVYEKGDTRYVLDSEILYKVTAENGSTTWTMQARVPTGEDETEVQTVTIENGADIYVSYVEKSPGYTPPSPSPQDVKGPITEKTVTDNRDGTYNIRLDITGQKDHTVNKTGANVVVVLDRTQSMSNDIDPGVSRMAAARSALQTLINTLNPGPGENENLINFTVVGFANRAKYYDELAWTQEKSMMLNYAQTVTDLGNNSAGNGTCWQAGLYGGIVRANDAATNANLNKNKTYVIFVTDGDPNGYYTRSNSDGGPTNNPDYHGPQWGPGFVQNAYDYAVPNAVNCSALVGNRFYGVYCGGANDTGKGHLQDLMSATNQGSSVNGTFIDGTSEETIINAFQNIANTIVLDLGASEVIADDGIPTLANVSAAVSGSAGGFKYYIKPKNGTETEWEDAPSAGYSSSNGVTWDLSPAGVLADGTVYSVEFTVWPSQKAYDLLADLKNGLKKLGELDSVTLKQLKIEIDGTVYVYDGTKWTGNKTTEELLGLINSANKVNYDLMTNTHLNTTYKYKEVSYSDSPDPLPNGAMPLPVEKISLRKIWPENILDDYQHTMYEQGMTLHLARDQEKEYYAFHVGTDTDWKKEDVYISCGNMVVDSNGAVNVNEKGHDYQIVEPPEYSYIWDLISDVYHPMVINGTTTMLIKVKNADVPSGMPSTNNIKYTDTTTGKVYYRINNTVYVVSDSISNTMEGSNYRRSNLNIRKVVSTGKGKDDYFTYTATVTDALSPDGKVWFSAKESAAEDSPFIMDEDWVIEGATAEIKEGSRTGYWYAENGTEVKFRIKPDWNVRFMNLLHGSTFTIEETEMPYYYQFNKVEATKEFQFMFPENKTNGEDTTEWYSIDNKEITGTILEPNNRYHVTYTNDVYFFVYHSGVAGDGHLESVKIENGKVYDLTKNLTENTLYGGYYLNYAGKGSYKDDGVAANDGVAYNGVNYSWSDPQKTPGNAISKPIAGETYYIKEVPKWYLQNYCHYQNVIATGELTSLYLVSAIDDANYKETGFNLTKTEGETISEVRVTRSLTFRKEGRADYVITPYNVFGKKGMLKEPEETDETDTEQDDYITYWKATKTYFCVGEFTMRPYWKTPDDIVVDGSTTRTVTINSLYKTGISATEN